MNRQATKAYARRDWSAPERLRLQERQVEFRKEGSKATVRASRKLWDFARSLKPGWPSKRLRDDDLAHHIELKNQLERAARGFPVR